MPTRRNRHPVHCARSSALRCAVSACGLRTCTGPTGHRRTSHRRSAALREDGLANTQAGNHPRRGEHRPTCVLVGDGIGQWNSAGTLPAPGGAAPELAPLPAAHAVVHSRRNYRQRCRRAVPPTPGPTDGPRYDPRAGPEPAAGRTAPTATCARLPRPNCGVSAGSVTGSTGPPDPTGLLGPGFRSGPASGSPCRGAGGRGRDRVTSTGRVAGTVGRFAPDQNGAVSGNLVQR